MKNALIGLMLAAGCAAAAAQTLSIVNRPSVPAVSFPGAFDPVLVGGGSMPAYARGSFGELAVSGLAHSSAASSFGAASDPSFAILGLTSLGQLANQTSYLVGFNDSDIGDADHDDLAVRVSASPIPEPSTYAMLLAGLGAVGFMARRRRPAD